jgi:hypothetical protein
LISSTQFFFNEYISGSFHDFSFAELCAVALFWQFIQKADFDLEGWPFFVATVTIASPSPVLREESDRAIHFSVNHQKYDVSLLSGH